MAVLEIRKYPDPVLRKKALAVEAIDEALLRLIDDMVETMYAAPGVGLAAPQVGVSKRVIVVDVGSREEGRPLTVLINPVIVEREGSAEGEEGCLSLPDFTASIKRSEMVAVEGLDRRGTPVRVEAEGLFAVALQHEMDHLDGTLILDRASLLKREFFKKRFEKLAARAV
jgi:peptide deformylase